MVDDLEGALAAHQEEAIMDMRLACKCPGDDGRGSETTQFSRHRLPASS